jgi:hypothetical protein
MQEQYITTLKSGDKYYYKDKAKTILHREDGPAVEYVSGSKTWYGNGNLHRLDGPAVEWTGGGKEWFVDDVFIMKVDSKGEITNRMR